MAYSADSFVADEQPTTAKWNKLWSNDAAFNDGTGIANDAITANHVSGIAKDNLTTDSNPYKFSVYASSTVTITSATQKVAFNTENFDTNNNFDSSTNYRYTSPIAGFFFLSLQVAMGSAGMGSTETARGLLYKNGSMVRASMQFNGSNDATRLPRGGVCALLSLAATDYVEGYAGMGGVYRDIVGGSSITYFDGALISQT